MSVSVILSLADNNVTPNSSHANSKSRVEVSLTLAKTSSECENQKQIINWKLPASNPSSGIDSAQTF